MHDQKSGHSCAYCHGFMDIPPVIRGRDGQLHLNPDSTMIKRFHIAAEPFGATVPVGETREFVITPPAEGSSFGDFLITDLFLSVRQPGLLFELLLLPANRTLQNAPVDGSIVFGNAYLGCPLPCCILLQATNSLIVRATNVGTAAAAANVSITARGARFLPQDEGLRQRMLDYWNRVPSYPYFLTLDESVVEVPGGETVTADMKVQGDGDFEVKYARCSVTGVTTDDLLVSVSEGVGRKWESEPLPLATLVAAREQPLNTNVFRPANLCHCPGVPQMFKRNQVIRHTFTNLSVSTAQVRVTYAGCFHAVNECPPARSMDMIRSLEPTIGPMRISESAYCGPEGYAPEAAAYPEPAPALPAPQPPAPVAPPSAATPPARQRFLNMPIGQSARTIVPGGPMSYMLKYYERDPVTGQLRRKPQGLSGLQPGQSYYDPIAREWRRA
jgi:hypothetical protein